MNGWMDGKYSFNSGESYFTWMFFWFPFQSRKVNPGLCISSIPLARSPSFHENNEGDCLSSWKEEYTLLPTHQRNPEIQPWMDGQMDGRVNENCLLGSPPCCNKGRLSCVICFSENGQILLMLARFWARSANILLINVEYIQRGTNIDRQIDFAGGGGATYKRIEMSYRQT